VGKQPVTGCNTIDRFNKLIRKGRTVLDKASGTYFQMQETNDYEGQRIAKIFDSTIHDQNTELSKITHGPEWTRGGYGK